MRFLSSAQSVSRPRQVNECWLIRPVLSTVDKLESMIGSYGPSPDPVTKRFVSEEAPSGMLARSGSYAVRSRVIDDDKNVYVDFEWTFKLAKEW